MDALRDFEDLLSSLAVDKRENLLPALNGAGRVYLLAANSSLARGCIKGLSARLLEVGCQVTLVDDTLSQSPVTGCELIGTSAFVAMADRRAIAANLALSPYGYEFFEHQAARAGIKTVDAVPLFDALGFTMIYQTASLMREETLERLDAYVALARQLDDAWSIRTLGACLAMRIRLDRRSLLPILCSREDEYFMAWPAGKETTFAMGEDETLVDIGACYGDTVKKFLAATGWKYGAIHAFEPDALNLEAMTRDVFSVLERFHLHQVALSDKSGTMAFAQTGTMGSHLDAAGGVEVQIARLDDHLAHATFIKMDTEGHEMKVLQGARQLIARSKPRMAITGYHYANDLLGIAGLVREIVPEYRLRLRHHSFWYYDTVLYADVPMPELRQA